MTYDRARQYKSDNEQLLTKIGQCQIEIDELVHVNEVSGRVVNVIENRLSGSSRCFAMNFKQCKIKSNNCKATTAE